MRDGRRQTSAAAEEEPSKRSGFQLSPPNSNFSREWHSSPLFDAVTIHPFVCFHSHFVFGVGITLSHSRSHCRRSSEPRCGSRSHAACTLGEYSTAKYSECFERAARIESAASRAKQRQPRN